MDSLRFRMYARPLARFSSGVIEVLTNTWRLDMVIIPYLIEFYAASLRTAKGLLEPSVG
jgi:hypothetical protein